MLTLTLNFNEKHNSLCSRQNITSEDINEVVKVLSGDFITQGPKNKEFEVAFAKRMNAKFAVAVANGTAALHLGTLVLGLKSNQKVITTPITFSNC